MHQLEEDTSSVAASTIEVIPSGKSSDMDSPKTLVVVLVVACCCIVAIVLAAVALNNSKNIPSINVQTSGFSSDSSSSSTNGVKRTFTIAFGHDWGGHNYIDEEGYITGFSKELIEAVCEAANIDCETIWDKWINCVDSTAGEHSAGGIGLLGRWYDGCMGWAITATRIQIFKFGISYINAAPTNFYVKKGANFDPSNIEGKKMGFMDGWGFDEKCIARQDKIKGHVIPVDKITHYLQVKDAIDSLLNGTVDVLTGDRVVFQEWMDKDQIEAKGEFSCFLGGSTMMTRKDEHELLRYWNEGFQKIQASGKFRKICAEANDKHGHKGAIDCVGS